MFNQKRQARTTLAAVLVAFVGSAVSLIGHHGWSGYDEKSPLTLTGTVKAAGYENPHGFVDLEVSGKVWRVVLAPPSRMENRGLAKDSLKPGAQATVMGYPNKTDASELRAERITIGGKTTELR